uniref:Uncharacterized protein LOC104218456 n=1 Tax=Nicotiana sylvestris TaxID=4096 RepID=A0A1U7VQM9_NICSY|nr:PREDICTED: uncharacterized protein LOC104218456 [Nicotiana sylvestris]
MNAQKNMVMEKSTEIGQSSKTQPIEPESKQGSKLELNWGNLFTSNKLVARGMSLTYIAPVIHEGEKITQLQQHEIEEDTEKWKLAVILYVVGDFSSIGSLEHFIAMQWNFAAKPKIFYHNNGYFVVMSNNMDDKNEG